jgi:hypothetical protein
VLREHKSHAKNQNCQEERSHVGLNYNSSFSILALYYTYYTGTLVALCLMNDANRKGFLGIFYGAYHPF